MKKSILLFIFIEILSSCTKYDNGPLITFRSKTKRLCHTWVYESIVNTSLGITITSNLPNIEMTFEKNGKYFESNNVTGEWKFKGEVDLEIKKFFPNDSIVIEVFEISRLSNTELWLRKNNEIHHFKRK
ncbi:MAG: hypothetical protein N3A01_02470 [Bacteroidales bacterium]|nr:hypothetical protein [Bacteroidales bacterium]